MNEERARPKRKRKSGKLKDVLLLSVLALILVVAVWRIFYREDASKSVSTYGTESEKALKRLLSEIEGVGEVEVMICEEDGVKSVVVVCDGAKDIRVNSEIREATAAALGTEEKNVKVYLKKD